MTTSTVWESIKVDGEAILGKLRELLHEGNVTRVRVQHQGHTVAEFPLTIGVVGALFAPLLAAVGALLALLKDCTIEVQREKPADAAKAEPAAKS